MILQLSNWSGFTELRENLSLSDARAAGVGRRREGGARGLAIPPGCTHVLIVTYSTAGRSSGSTISMP